MTTTIREHYIKEQAEALRNSEFQDFEWIVNDDLYESRKDELPKWVDGKFPLIHLLPPVISDHFAVVDTLNEGFRHCSGELVFFMVDYVIPHKDCLGRHWELYQTYPNCFFSGRSIATGMTGDELAKAERFHGDDYRMGLFTNAIFQSRWVNDDMFEVFPDGVQNYWAGRNDSAPMEAILKVNGFDRRLDGFHGYQDSDLGQRMMRAGYRYLIDTKASALELKHDRMTRPGIRTQVEHQQLAHRVFKEVQQGRFVANPEMNLREEREKRLAKNI